ncbi:MAG: hypothetical protein V4676_07350 [Bacteroidota bacterium]
MYSYGLLEPGCYYLVQEKENAALELIKVTVETEQCMYVFKYKDELVTEWKKKNDQLHDILECLSDDVVAVWKKHYNEESYLEEDEE